MWSWRIARPSSAAISTARTSGAATPSRRRRRPRVPSIGLVKDCVAIAPTPLAVQTQRAPTAKALVVMAMPKAPLLGSRAMIDQVMAAAALHGHEARPRAALDRRRDQPVDVEMMADELEDAQLLLARLAIGGGDIANERVGGLAQLPRQRRPDLLEGLVEPVVAAEQLRALIELAGQLVAVVIREDRQVAHVVADDAKLPIAHVAVGGRDQDHGVDQRRLVIDHGRSSAWEGPPCQGRGGRLSSASDGCGLSTVAKNAAVRSTASLRPTRSGTTPSGKAP